MRRVRAGVGSGSVGLVLLEGRMKVWIVWEKKDDGNNDDFRIIGVCASLEISEARVLEASHRRGYMYFVTEHKVRHD